MKVDEKFLEDNEVFTEMVYYEGDREDLKAQIDKCESKTSPVNSRCTRRASSETKVFPASILDLAWTQIRSHV